MASLPELIEVPTIIREIFYPPPCPEEVAALLDAALAYQNSGHFALSIRTFIEAQHKWEFLRGWANVPEAEKDRFSMLPEPAREAFLRDELTPVAISDEAICFIRLSIGSVFESAGRDDHALAEYLVAHEHSLRLRPNHPTHATIASCLGSVYANFTRYDIAGDYFLRALDIRERLLGPRHVDTAATLNNVAAVLHRMDRVSQALPFYRKAEAIFLEQFQVFHPRVLAVQRNIQQAERRALKFAPHSNIAPLRIAPIPVDAPIVPGNTSVSWVR